MTDGSRITNIDALRGFALFGILLVNILAFSSAYYGTGIQPPGGRALAAGGLRLCLYFI